MSSYSEIKSDVAGLFGFLGLAALAALGLSLFGAAGLIIGVPEHFVVPGDLDLYDLGDQLHRGGLFSAVSIAALYGLINLQLALLVDEDSRDVLVALLGLNFIAGVFSFVVIAFGDLLIFRVIGLMLGYGMRYLGNPLVCVLWLGFGYERYSQGRGFTAMVALLGVPGLWGMMRVLEKVWNFLFQSVA